jgi:putative photosynthetic complex assembly protein 2
MSWTVQAWAVAATILLWWGATGLIASLIARPSRTYPGLLWGASVAALAALATLWWIRDDPTVPGAAIGFVAALVVWGWIEVTFLTGLITGPRRTLPASVAPRGARHALAAFVAILWHELAIIVAIAAVALLGFGHVNQIGLGALLVLWVMRSSAKLNLFLGVRNLGEGFIPPHLRHLLDYLHRRRMNALWPFSAALGSALALWLGSQAMGDAPPWEATGYTMLATLAWLGVLEHFLMVLPLPPEALWRRVAAPRAAPDAIDQLGEQRP